MRSPCLLTIIVEDIPHVAQSERLTSAHVTDGIYRCESVSASWMKPMFRARLANATEQRLGFFYEPMRISYFLSRETIIASDKPGMDPLREALFAWMSRSASSPRWNSFRCRSTGWSNWATRSRSDFVPFGWRPWIHTAPATIPQP